MPPDPTDPLTLDTFAAAQDPEAARYRILAGLGRARDAFRHQCVFPHLGALVRLRRELADLLEGADRAAAAQPGRIVGVDWEAGRVVHERAVPPLLAADLARWALPRLDVVLGEGRTLYDFADRAARLDAVGLVPRYRAEGFLIVPGEDGAPGQTVRYAVSALAGADGAYRSLRTSPAGVDLDPLAPPAVWKQALARAHPDLPAPATFRLATEIDLPVEPTMMPLAKRKLLALVQAWGEA